MKTLAFLIVTSVTILAAVATVVLRADDPPPEGAPLMRSNAVPHHLHHGTNSPAVKEALGVQHLESAESSTNAPTIAKPAAAPLPIYVIGEVFAVRTPAGEFHRVSDADFENLARKFGPAVRLTNFVIYAPSPK